MRRTLLVFAVASMPGAEGWVSAARAEIAVPGGALNGSISAVNNYVTRGISNSDGNPALQALAEYNHHSGFYIGGFVSNVDFDDDHNAQAETDVWGGYMVTWRNVTLRADALAYFYPGVEHNLSDDFNTVEYESTIQYRSGEFAVTAGAAYSPNYFFNSGDSLYYELDVSVPLYRRLGLQAHVGHQSVEANVRFGMPDYTDWLIGVYASYWKLTAGLYYVDTDVNRRACFGGKEWCSAQVLAQISYIF